MTREIARALSLQPRGGVAHDVLHLDALSLRLRVEWQARDVHPWDRDLSEHRQAQLFARQCLKDVDTAIARVFDRVPGDGECWKLSSGRPTQGRQSCRAWSIAMTFVERHISLGK